MLNTKGLMDQLQKNEMGGGGGGGEKKTHKIKKIIKIKKNIK
jgi:hypothetical protein